MNSLWLNYQHLELITDPLSLSRVLSKKIPYVHPSGISWLFYREFTIKKTFFTVHLLCKCFYRYVTKNSIPLTRVNYKITFDILNWLWTQIKITLTKNFILTIWFDKFCWLLSTEAPDEKQSFLYHFWLPVTYKITRCIKLQPNYICRRWKN